MNGLITGSERRRNTVWRGDEWNGELGLRKPLRQIEGINDCNTARGPQWPTLFPGTMAVCNGFLSCSFQALVEQWLCGSVVDKMFFSTPPRLYEVSKRLLSETTRTTCTTLETRHRL